MLLASIVVHHDIVGCAIQPGLRVSVGAAAALSSPQQTVEDLGRQVSGGLHVTHLSVDVTVDGLVVLVVDSSQPVPVKGPVPVQGLVLSPLKGSVPLQGARWPPMCLSVIAQHLFPVLYRTYEEGNRYGLVPLKYTTEI